jgi:hypothetical protein
MQQSENFLWGEGEGWGFLFFIFYLYFDVCITFVVCALTKFNETLLVFLEFPCGPQVAPKK